MNPGQDLDHHAETHLSDIRYTLIIWVIKVPAEKYGVFNPYMVIDDHGYDGNHINGFIDLTDKGMGVRQL